jgi:colanic acid biosynthesis glycosyl transferase WcaI
VHIVFFNRSYHPDPEATGQYLTELAEDLVARGEDVSVVCGRSYHVKGRRWPLLVAVNRRAGVRVVRAFNTQFPKRSLAGRLANLATYFATCLLAVLFVPRPDVVVCLTDPPVLPLLAATYARLMGARFVFAINDLYPDVAVELGQVSNVALLKLLAAATAFGLRHADLVTVLGDDMKAKVLVKGCPSGRVAVAPYWVDPNRVRPSKEGNRFRREAGIGPSDFVVMYSGNLGLSQCLEDVVRVAARFRDRDDVRFLIVGDGAEKRNLEGLATDLELDGKVRFFPYQPKECLGESLSAADLHLIPLAPGVAGSIVPCKVCTASWRRPRRT